MKDQHDIAAKRGYLSQDGDANQRVALLESKGREQRVEKVKDEMRILNYMSSKGIVPRQGETSLIEYGMDNTSKGTLARDIVTQFRNTNANHPVRDIAGAE